MQQRALFDARPLKEFCSEIQARISLPRLIAYPYPGMLTNHVKRKIAWIINSDWSACRFFFLDVALPSRPGNNLIITLSFRPKHTVFSHAQICRRVDNNRNTVKADDSDEIRLIIVVTHVDDGHITTKHRFIVCLTNAYGVVQEGEQQRHCSHYWQIVRLYERFVPVTLKAYNNRIREVLSLNRPNQRQ